MIKDWQASRPQPVQTPLRPVEDRPTAAPAEPDRSQEYAARAREDLPQVKSLRSKFEAAARNHAVPVEYLEGVISRETRVGKALPASGFGGKDGKMYGLGQINSEVHELRGTDAPDSQDHLDQSAQILSEYKRLMDKKFPNLSEEARWRAAIAGYNAGPSNISDPNNPDAATDGHDYSKDVMERAKYFRSLKSKSRARR